MRVAAVAARHRLGGPRWRTLDRLAPMIADAAAGGARLIVRTEPYSTGSPATTRRAHRGAAGRWEQNVFTRRPGRASRGVGLRLGARARTDGSDRPVNLLVLVGPDGERHHYGKIHPFSYGHEDEHYGVGDRTGHGDVEGFRLTLFVCYDLRFADQFWALAARHRPAFVVVANRPVRAATTGAPSRARRSRTRPT